MGNRRDEEGKDPKESGESGGQELSYIPQTHSRHNIFPQKSLLMCSVT